MNELTKKLLTECSKHKIKRVAIGVYDENIESCRGWTYHYNGSIFTENIRDKDGWPAIWGIVENLDIAGSCGSSGQHDIIQGKIDDGIYQFKDGEWEKVD